MLITVTNDLTYDQRMARIAGSLQRSGYTVTLIGRQRPSSVTLAAKPYQQKRLFCFFEQGKLFYIEMQMRLFFYLLIHSFDIIYAVDLDTLLPATIVSRIKRKKLIYDAHEYFSETPEVVRRPRVQKVWEWVAKKCIPRADTAITVSHSLAEELSARYKQPFNVIRNMPELRPLDKDQAFNQNIPKHSSAYIILYQGALNEGRGLEAAISAMQYITDVELWLAGEGDLSAALRAQAIEQGVEDKVRFLGYQQPEQLWQITQQAYIGLNLLENRGKSYYYSLANKAFDYIHAHVPAIHMNFPEYKNMQAQYETALLIPDLDEKTIVAAIRRLIADKALYDRLQQNCVEAKREWCWEGEVSVLFSVI